ncbi:MAG: RdgB/HAM1 family non-canonical purine NTP pyrophosphatase [Betaproteobacteria bacterium]|nr:RdgB/HAM1 family non-canonical purine NTP pyrophosphatase [Betaproteobacteria bacterium]MDH3435859.1 RdgB/HAM1 family non-canonical purine NTP pyrophosphatase [Betaproteobacteria bacterium]
MKKLVLASSNPGKLREFRQMLGPLGIEVVPQSELGIADGDEPHETFVENALAKARHASRYSGLPAFADDSGICVNALNGAPGVFSARYATADTGGRDEQDRRNNEKLIAELRDKSDRSAHYYCVIVLVRHADDPEPLIAEGRWFGEVVASPRGANGFGYDPYFFLPSLGKSAAELAPDDKNEISHRGHAAAQLVAQLRVMKNPER